MSYPFGDLGTLHQLLIAFPAAQIMMTIVTTRYDHRGRIAETYMLIDEQNGNILPLLGKLIKRGFDRGVFGFAVHHQEVLLRIRRLRDVLPEGGSVSEVVRCLVIPGRALTPTPANSRPVTESYSGGDGG
jgi:hypothetical protein